MVPGRGPVVLLQYKKRSNTVGNVGDYLRELLPPTTLTLDLSHSTINALQSLLPDLSLATQTC